MVPSLSRGCHKEFGEGGRPRIAPYHTVRVVVHHSKFRWLMKTFSISSSTQPRSLARLLLLLANFGKEGRPEPLIAKISQKTLAEMIGTTRSRVSLFMNKFRELGFISYNGQIEIHSSLLRSNVPI